MNKLIESFNKLNDQARYCLLVGVVFLIILLDVVFLVLPQMASIGSINDQIKKLSDDTQEVLSERPQTKQRKNKLDTARAQYSALSMKVHTIQEIPAILSTISSIANEYGVKIDQLVPKKDQPDAVAKAPAKKVEDTPYYALPIVIKAHGGYHMFGRFLSKLEAQNFFVILKDFIIQNDDKDPNSRLFSVTVDIVLGDKTSPSKNL